TSDLAPGKDAQRKVLGQIVARENRMPEQCGKAENDGRHCDEANDSHNITGPTSGRTQVVPGACSRCRCWRELRRHGGLLFQTFAGRHPAKLYRDLTVAYVGSASSDYVARPPHSATAAASRSAASAKSSAIW